MQIKITGRTPELFNQFLKSVLNIATVVAQYGYLPTRDDISDPERTGRYWFREGDSFRIASISNNMFCSIREEGENYMVLEFSYRYDKDGIFANALTNLLAARFRDEVEVL